MTVTAPIGTAARANKNRAIATIALAFSTDPTVRWGLPDPHQFFSFFMPFVEAYGGKALDHGSAHVIDDYSGVALWLPPGVLPDDESIVQLCEAHIPEPKRSAVFALFEQMSSYHPHEPHWFLSLIGVDPMLRGRGLGTALMRHALAGCDRDGAAAYLESTNPANLPLYERHGFKVIGEIQAGDSPIMYPMLRNPQYLNPEFR